MRVAILGLGVMGGSLARALAGGEERTVLGWTPDAEERLAVDRSGIPTAGSAASAVREADVVVLATPLGAFGDLAGRLAGTAPASAGFTDVASLQAPALAAAVAAGLADRWVSAHPLVGSERSGFEASAAGLYRGAPLFLSASADVPVGVRTRIEGLWSGIGAATTWIDPAAHDARMAHVSHLPQVVSTALADTLAGAGVAATYLGPGGRDTTRLAGSSPAMWRDLLAHRDPALVTALRAVARRLEADADELEGGRVEGVVDRLTRACAWRSEA